MGPHPGDITSSAKSLNASTTRTFMSQSGLRRERLLVSLKRYLRVVGFPPHDEPTRASEVVVDAITRNHPSFRDKQGMEEAPGLSWVREQLEEGRVRLFRDKADAEEWLKQPAWPSPLGNISKVKADGSIKNRPVQDQRRNGVSSWVTLPERQVLPRPLESRGRSGQTPVGNWAERGGLDSCS